MFEVNLSCLPQRISKKIPGIQLLNLFQQTHLWQQLGSRFCRRRTRRLFLLVLPFTNSSHSKGMRQGQLACRHGWVEHGCDTDVSNNLYLKNLWRNKTTCRVIDQKNFWHLTCTVWSLHDLLREKNVSSGRVPLRRSGSKLSPTWLPESQSIGAIRQLKNEWVSTYVESLESNTDVCVCVCTPNTKYHMYCVWVGVSQKLWIQKSSEMVNSIGEPLNKISPKFGNIKLNIPLISPKSNWISNLWNQIEHNAHLTM